MTRRCRRIVFIKRVISQQQSATTPRRASSDAAAVPRRQSVLRTLAGPLTSLSTLYGSRRTTQDVVYDACRRRKSPVASYSRLQQSTGRQLIRPVATGSCIFQLVTADTGGARQP